MTGTSTELKPKRIISISDIHLGHKLVDTMTICARLTKYVFSRLAETDVLFIGGDLYDTLMSLTDVNVNFIVAFLIDLLQEANKYNVVIRVLRGTRSHDRTQCSIIPILHRKYRFDNDVAYVDTLSCEYIESLDMRVLYIPDDLPFESSYDAMDVIRELLSQRGWDKFDYVIAHGYFEHMLRPGIPHKPRCTFTVDQFRDIVSRYVLIGHVHTHSVNEFVLGNGSFDRLAHGEEEPKGFLYITDYGDKAKLEFVENIDASKFYTIDLSNIEDRNQIINEYIQFVDTKFGSDGTGHIRSVHPSSEVRQILAKITATKYPHLVYKHKIADQAAEPIQVQRLLELGSYPVPSEENIAQMIATFIKSDVLSIPQINDILKTL